VTGGSTSPSAATPQPPPSTRALYRRAVAIGWVPSDRLADDLEAGDALTSAVREECVDHLIALGLIAVEDSW